MLERRHSDHRACPAGFMGSIMQLGTTAAVLQRRSGPPLENPTGLTNLLYIWLTLSIRSLSPTPSQDGGSIAMVLPAGGHGDHIRVWWASPPTRAPKQPGRRRGARVLARGNMEGKEVRFGDTTSACSTCL